MIEKMRETLGVKETLHLRLEAIAVTWCASTRCHPSKCSRRWAERSTYSGGPGAALRAEVPSNAPAPRHRGGREQHAHAVEV